MSWLLMPFRRLTDFHGRSRRIEFWIFWLGALIMQMIASYIDTSTKQPMLVGSVGPVTLITTLILLMPATTVGIRGLHDTGRPGWWMLLFAIPYAGWLISTATGEQTMIAALTLLLGSLVLLILLVQPGTPGDNVYGPDPKTSASIADGVTTP